MMSIQKKVGWLVSLASLVLVVGTDKVIAQIGKQPQAAKTEHQTQYRRIEQPLALKLAVTTGGVALIGLEIGWFLFGKENLKVETNQRYDKPVK